MDLLSKENERKPDNCSSQLMDVAYSVIQKFYAYRLEHPDENLAEVEQSVSRGVWRLLKAAELISLAEHDLQ